MSLFLRRGEVLAPPGPNGASRSTAISLWFGLNLQDRDSVELFGELPLRLSARRRIVMLQ